MLADLSVADGKLLAQLEVFGIYDGLVVECTEKELALFVAVMYAHPHPFAGNPRSVCRKLNFHIVVAVISRHVSPRQSSVEDESARNHIIVVLPVNAGIREIDLLYGWR